VALALGWVGGTKIEHSTWQMSTNLVVRCWAASQNGTKNIDESQKHAWDVEVVLLEARAV